MKYINAYTMEHVARNELPYEGARINAGVGDESYEYEVTKVDLVRVETDMYNATVFVRRLPLESVPADSPLR